MPNDFENAINLDQLDDAEVRDLVRQRLDEAEDFDVEEVDVSVRNGRVRVEGRVGTEEERQYVDQVLSGFGAEDFENVVIVDETRRAEQSQAADIAVLEDAVVEDQLGERGKATSDEAEHLQPDTAGEQFGTRDVRKAIEQGQSYTPPDGPVQEGVGEGETH